MKKLAVVLVVLCSHACVAQMIPKDKQMHLAAGFAFGGMVLIEKDTKHPFWNSVAMAATVGAAKEYYDSRVGGNVEAKDFYATVAGGMVSGTIGYLIKKRRDKKKKEYLRHRWEYRHYTRY